MDMDCSSISLSKDQVHFSVHYFPCFDLFIKGSKCCFAIKYVYIGFVYLPYKYSSFCMSRPCHASIMMGTKNTLNMLKTIVKHSTRGGTGFENILSKVGDFVLYTRNDNKS